MKKEEKKVCPVCGKYVFARKRDYDICKYCGWENDGYFEAGGANKLSLEDFRFRYNCYIENNPAYIWSQCGFPEINEED
ncbi:MAG: hypothetical protein IKS39_03545 [Clostridia bacterium]|nr:hypothetical protein [Clostridia bacterium]